MNLWQLNANLATTFINSKANIGPYSGNLVNSHVIDGIQCIRLRKDAPNDLKKIQNTTRLAREFSFQMGKLGVPHAVTFCNDGYRAIWLYIGTYYPEKDISKAKEKLKEKFIERTSCPYNPDDMEDYQ